MTVPIKNIRPIRRLFEVDNKVTGTNDQVLKSLLRKLKRRYSKILTGDYSDLEELKRMRSEMRLWELDVHRRRVIHNFVKSGSAKPSDTVVECFREVWKGEVERAKVAMFDHLQMGVYFWGKGKNITDVTKRDVEGMNSRVVDIMIAWRVLKILEDKNEVVSHMTDISYGGQQVKFRFP